MKNDPFRILNLAAQTIFNKKGFNILALDVRGISTMTDFFLIAEGTVDKHVVALGDAVLEALKMEEEKPIHSEGWNQGDWVVLDYLEVVIHLFIPGLRGKYRLEELWHEGKVIDLDIFQPSGEALAHRNYQGNLR
jgi:ribosome-associated protein